MNRRVLALLATAVLAAGCSGPSLPFRTGTGEDSYQITVHLADLGNLVPDADVKAADITVGTVTGMTFDNWTAKLTVSLQRSASLPANAEARVAQKSLLGAEYLELAPPRQGPAIGALRDGDDIPITRTGRYPETEELLAALSALLNQGGIGQLSTITAELDNALVGREGAARGLIHDLGALSSTLDAHKGDIVRALENVDRLSTTIAQQTQVVDQALQAIPPGLAALERQRGTLVETLDSVSALGDVAARVVDDSQADLHANLQALQPILGKLADSGKNLTESMGILPTFPFSTNAAFPAVVNGDYGNLYITADLDVKTLGGNLLRGLTIAGLPLLSGSSLAGGLSQATPLLPGLPQLPLPLPLSPGGSPPAPAPSTGGGLLGGLLGWLVPGGS
jgi:phospholipid/cholesterol/gamma-HCH transport system substrate-binding protein